MAELRKGLQWALNGCSGGDSRGKPHGLAFPNLRLLAQTKFR